MVQVGGRLLILAPLTGKQHAACVLIGFFSIPACALLKLVPDRIVKKLPILIDENKSMENDPILSAYNKSAKGGVLKKGDDKVKPQ